MKRALLSIVISTFLGFAYVFGLALFDFFGEEFGMGRLDEAMIEVVGLPMALPEFIHIHIGSKIGAGHPDDLGDDAGMILLFGGNGLLYSVPVYLLLTYLSRRRHSKNEPAYSAEPPAPQERF